MIINLKISAKEEAALIDIDAGEGTSNQQQPTARPNQSPTFRDAVKKIRFLTMSPQQFAENVPRTNLLTQSEAFSILMNISSPKAGYSLPEGFSTNTKSRALNQRISHDVNSADTPFKDASNIVGDNDPFLPPSPPESFFNQSIRFAATNALVSEPSTSRGRSYVNRRRDHRNQPNRDLSMDVTETRRFYCVRPIREQIDYFNTSVSDCSLTFTVDRNISITGIQVATQVLGEQNMQSGNLPERYSELLYAHLLDSYGTRLTYTHCTSNVRFDSLLEISFDHPVQIKRNRFYKIGVAFNKVGWYPMCTCTPTITCEGVCFDFRVDGANGESVRDGLIRAIVFTFNSEREGSAYHAEMYPGLW